MVNLRQIGVKAMKKPEVKELLKETQEVIKGITEKKIKRKPAETLEETIPVKKEKELVFKKKKAVKPEKDIVEAQDFLKDVQTKLKPSEFKYLNINKFNDQGDVLKLLKTLADRYAKDIDFQKRGVQTHEQTKAMADFLQRDRQKLTSALLTLKPGDTLNAAWLTASKDLLVMLLRKGDSLKDKALTGGPKELLDFKQHLVLMSEIHKIYIGAKTETARAFNALKIQPRTDQRFTTKDIDNLQIDQILIEQGGEEEIRGIAQAYSRLTKPEDIFKFSKEVGLPTKLSDSVSEIFLNVILSNPLTHIKNTGGNWITQAIVQQERKVAARLFGRGKIEDKVADYEDIAKAFGKSMALEEMWGATPKLALGKWKVPVGKPNVNVGPQVGGSKVELRPSKFTAENFGMPDNGYAKAVDMLGSAVTLGRIPTRFLTFADRYFKNGEYRSEIYALSFRKTMEKYNAGVLKKENMSAYLADSILHPSKEIQMAAKDAAQYITYQTPMGKRGDFLDVTKAAQIVKNKSGPFSFIANYYLPFVQTPTNIMGFTLERTPVLNLALKRYRQELFSSGPEADLAKAKMALGSAFFLPMMTAGYFGGFSGSDPELSTVKNVWTGGKREYEKLLGYQSKSLRIPDPNNPGEYFQINLTGADPIVMHAAMAADFGKLVGMVGDNHDQYQDLLAHSAAFTYILGENLMNSTFMQGAGKFVRDVRTVSTQGKAGWDKVGKSFMSAYVPGVVKQPFKVFVQDDYQKISTEWYEYLQRTTLDHGLEYDYNPLGERYEKFAFATKIKKDYIKDELLRVRPTLVHDPLNIEITVPNTSGKTVRVPLTSEERRFLKKNSGLEFRKELEKLLNKKYYYGTANKDATILEQQLFMKERESIANGRAKAWLMDKSRPYREDLETRAIEIFNTKEKTLQRGLPLPTDKNEETQ